MQKVAAATNNGSIEIWGDGLQTRSFLHIDECIQGTLKVMRSSQKGPFNIGSDEMVSINQLVSIVADVAGKAVRIKHVPGPQGVRGRRSDNTLIHELWDGILLAGLVKELKRLIPGLNNSFTPEIIKAITSNGSEAAPNMSGV